MLVDNVRLMRIGCPSIQSIKAFSLQVCPFALFDHELSSNLVPSWLPVDAGVKDHDVDFVDSHIAADQGEPVPIGHCSEFILVLDQTIIIQLVLVEGPLLVESHLVVLAKLLQGDYWVIASLGFELTLHFAFERRNEEAVGAFSHF